MTPRIHPTARVLGKGRGRDSYSHRRESFLSLIYTCVGYLAEAGVSLVEEERRRGGGRDEAGGPSDTGEEDSVEKRYDPLYRGPLT